MHAPPSYIRLCLLGLCLAGAVTGLRGAPAGRTSVRDTLPGFPSRSLRYRPEGGDFVIMNGERRFNRALYGGHTAFRVEAGDKPEFAIYEPGIAGSLKLGIETGRGTQWISNLHAVEARYRPGTMLYRITDPLLGADTLFVQVLATYDREAMLVRCRHTGRIAGLWLVFAFGGASGQHPSRNGDLGADPPELFDLTAAHAKGNLVTLATGGFRIAYRDKRDIRAVHGVLPPVTRSMVGDARRLDSPAATLAANDTAGAAPIALGRIPFAADTALYMAVFTADTALPAYKVLPALFSATEAARKRLADRVQVETPDPYLNTLGGTIAVAADAVWEAPAFLHGAVAWRMWLNGWRGAYAANDLGWHDRAKQLFSAYNQMQLTAPDTVVLAPDSAAHLARQTERQGVGIYNSGYITRYPEGKRVVNHYDMNLVYIDEMIRHFQWTGDTAMLRQCWPVLVRHLAWEKRNFDRDGNSLYDAYACIWASDALQYSAGDVTHSSAYNYFANRMAARIAGILGEDPAPYRLEASRIRHALDSLLWMPSRGWYAEYRDRKGLDVLHPSAGLWTIYHAIDSRTTDPFQAYECLRYVDLHIPHIPIRCADLKGTYEMLSTTNWMPYTWSVNNVAMAEMAHTALAYWQGGRDRVAMQVFKSMILESMYLGPSPGNFEQLSAYDRFRGVLYRDFADPIGITSRALVEGLFGIRPDALAGTLMIRPGLPAAWSHAAIRLPDIRYRYERRGDIDTYLIRPHFGVRLRLVLEVPARGTEARVQVNGKAVPWSADTTVGAPRIRITLPSDTAYRVLVTWNGTLPARLLADTLAIAGTDFRLKAPDGTRLLAIHDPEGVFSGGLLQPAGFRGKVTGSAGAHTFFVKLREGGLSWWEPVATEIRPAWELLLTAAGESGIRAVIRNNLTRPVSGSLLLASGGFSGTRKIRIPARARSASLLIPAALLAEGTNRVRAHFLGAAQEKQVTDWDLRPAGTPSMEIIPLNAFYNDRVTALFRHRYLSPRPAAPTLQLPWQGLGNWCSPLVTAEIDDGGLRRTAGAANRLLVPGGIPLGTPATDSLNILCTSKWDFYPETRTLPLRGKASHAYFLMAGTTDPMQSRVVNGTVRIRYRDGSSDSLLLINPGTWWPIEEDYRYDAYAFFEAQPAPYRVYLKSGRVTRHFAGYRSIKGLTDLGVPGGAATVLDLPLDPHRELDSLVLTADAGDVIIGLMSVTLVRSD